MSMENPPFEDKFPIEHGDFPASHVRNTGVYSFSVMVGFSMPVEADFGKCVQR